MHEIIRDIADDDRAYDPFGSGMAALSAACDALHLEGADVPDVAGYRPGVFGPDLGDAQTATIRAGLHPERFDGFWVAGYAPNLSVSDLQYAVRILSRYVDWVRLAGRDY